MLKQESIGLITYFLRQYPRRSALIIALLILSGFAEGIGVLSLLPLLEMATGDRSPDSAIANAAADVLGRIGLEPTLGVLLSFIVVGMFFKGAFFWLANREVGYTVAHVATQLRLMLIRALLRARWSYFVSQRSGQISNAMSNETHRASMAYAAACSLLAVVVQALLYAALAFIISPTVAVASILAGSLVMLILLGMIRMGRDAGLRQTELIRSLSGRLVDAMQAIKPIKAMAQEHHLQPLLEAEARDLNEAQRRQVVAAGTLTAFQEPLVVVMLAIGLFVALTWFEVAFTSLLVMALLFYRLVGRINLLQTHYQSMVISESAFWSLRRSVELAEREAESTHGVTAPPPLAAGIRLTDVHFSHGETKVLSGVSMDIPAGSFVSVVGPSGAGKTTLIDLITGLYVPEEGVIEVDGIPLGAVDLVAWRRLIGYVPQEMLLFHDSIYRNVTLGDEDIPRQAVERALREAGAWPFVSKLQNGMDTVIGERGTRLSGGQRQRIAIARALVRNPRLLILDEVTTALDPQTEAAICNTLRGLAGSHTIIAISHQRVMVEAADFIYQISEGQCSLVGGALASETSGLREHRHPEAAVVVPANRTSND